jgi:hypothetical protein
MKNYKNTIECFEDIVEVISSGKQKEAGDIFEEFLKAYFLHNLIYKEVYNTNRPEEIPQWILKKINAEQLVEATGDSPLIDMIGIDHHGEIDVIQGKSTMHVDSNASMNLATGLMSSVNNPLVNVKNYVFCSMYKDVSKLFDVWKVTKPKVYSYEDFLPGDSDESIRQDESMWKNNEYGKQVLDIIKDSNVFQPRGNQQTDYIDASYNGLRNQLVATGFAKGYSKGAGALGKSWLASVICARLQNDFWQSWRTNSPTPVHVSFFHSSQTINDNGSTEIMVRKGFGIHDEVIIVSGSDVIDKDSADKASDKFTKISANQPVKIVDKIMDAMNVGRSVHLVTLYHHSNEIAEIRRLLRKEYKGFEFWSRRRDECDWPCSNYHSSYSASLDDRTKSIITYGDTGTDRFGDPHKDYGTNNQDIHGPLLHSYTWADAERDKLVKPLILIPVVISVKELILAFPDLVDKSNNFNFNARVIGEPIDNELPTNFHILTIAAVQKALCNFPQIKRSMQFSGRVKTNALIRKNWKWVADKILGRTKTENYVRNLYKDFEVINDNEYNANAVKSSITSLKRCKAVDRSIMGSCRVFNRGWNDVPPKGYKKKWLKFHAGWHTGERNLVDLVQEIWRFVRLDSNDNDPFAYYIQPLILNDLDTTNEHWSKGNIKHLVDILKSNKNIADEFESLQQKGGGGNTKSKKNKRLQFVWPADFDPSKIDFTINSIAMKAGGGKLYPDLATEAHDWLTNEYLKLDEPANAQTKGKLHKKFYEIEKFKPLYSHYGNKIVWRERFYHGKYSFDPAVSQHINDNLMSYKKYCKQQESWIEEKKQLVRDIVRKGRMMQIHLDKNYFPSHAKLCEQFGWPKSRSHSYVEKHCADIQDDKTIDAHIMKTNVGHVFDCLIKTAPDSECMDEWAYKTAKAIDREIIDMSIFDRPIYKGQYAKDSERGKTRWSDSTVMRRFIKAIPNKGEVRYTSNDLTQQGFHSLDKKKQEQLIDLRKLVHKRSLMRGKMSEFDKKSMEDYESNEKFKYATVENKAIIKWLLARDKFVPPKKTTWRPCSEETKKKISHANLKAAKIKSKIAKKSFVLKNNLLSEVLA